MSNKIIHDHDSVKKTRLILETALGNVCEKGSSHFKGIPLIRWKISKESTLVHLLDTKSSDAIAEASLLLTIKIEGGLYKLIPFANKQELLNMLIQEVKRLGGVEKMNAYDVASFKVFDFPSGSNFHPESSASKIIEGMDQNLPVDNLINVASRRMIDLKIIGEDIISLRGKDATGLDLWEIYDNALPMIRQLGSTQDDDEIDLSSSQNLQIALNNTKNSKPMLAIRRSGNELHMYANTASGKILLAFIDHAILEGLLGSAKRDLNG